MYAGAGVYLENISFMSAKLLCRAAARRLLLVARHEWKLAMAKITESLRLVIISRYDR